MLTIFWQSRSLIDPTARWRWIALLGLSLVLSLLEVIGASLMLSLLSYISGADDAITLPVFGAPVERFPDVDPDIVIIVTTAAMAAFFLVRSLATIVVLYLQNRVAFNASIRLSRRILRGYFSMPYVQFTRRSPAELLRNTHELPLSFASMVLIPGLSLVNEVLVILAIACVLLVSAPVTTLGAIVLLFPVVAILLRVLSPRLSHFGRLANDLTVESLKALQQIFGGMRDITVLGREAYFDHAFFRTRERFSRVYYLRAVFTEMPRVTLEVAVLSLLLLFIAASVAFDQSSSTTLTVLGLFAYGVLRALPSLVRILAAVNGLRYSRAVLTALHDDVLAGDATAWSRAPSGTIGPLQDAVRVDDVCFWYPGAEGVALEHIDLVVKRGQSVGLVGPSGGGKSTLLDVLIGLVEPTSGAVTIDGTDVRADRRGWQDQIGLVAQNPFILDDTVRSNIALGIDPEEIDEDRFLEAVDIAQLGPVLEQLPQGLDTVVGDRGVLLSGGERQRVAIARALYRRPNVLVFDEGTSALDNATEARLLAALRALRGSHTAITAAHRLSTVRDADVLFVVAGGRIVERGTYDELSHDSQLFHTLAIEAP